MDGDINLDRRALTKYGIGQPVPRNEDPALLRGEGCYTDDLNLPGQGYAVIVRSRHAHGIINAIDTSEALTMPGVLGIYPGLDSQPPVSSRCRSAWRFFMDYGLPRASDAVMFEIDSHPVPARTNPLGAKGCGEAGCAGSLPAVMNAVVDA